MNKNCPLKLPQCGDHCKYFRMYKDNSGTTLRIVGCVFKPCHECPQPPGKGPEECFEGMAVKGDCERLLKGQYWDECPYGGRWKG